MDMTKQSVLLEKAASLLSTLGKKMQIIENDHKKGNRPY